MSMSQPAVSVNEDRSRMARVLSRGKRRAVRLMSALLTLFGGSLLVLTGTASDHAGQLRVKLVKMIRRRQKRVFRPAVLRAAHRVGRLARRLIER